MDLLRERIAQMIYLRSTGSYQVVCSETVGFKPFTRAGQSRFSRLHAEAVENADNVGAGASADLTGDMSSGNPTNRAPNASDSREIRHLRGYLATFMDETLFPRFGKYEEHEAHTVVSMLCQMSGRDETAPSPSRVSDGEDPLKQIWKSVKHSPKMYQLVTLSAFFDRRNGPPWTREYFVAKLKQLANEMKAFIEQTYTLARLVPHRRFARVAKGVFPTEFGSQKNLNRALSGVLSRWYTMLDQGLGVIGITPCRPRAASGSRASKGIKRPSASVCILCTSLVLLGYRCRPSAVVWRIIALLIDDVGRTDARHRGASPDFIPLSLFSRIASTYRHVGLRA